MSAFSNDPFLTYVAGPEHHARLRRAADERRIRRLRRRNVAPGES